MSAGIKLSVSSLLHSGCLRTASHLFSLESLSKRRSRDERARGNFQATLCSPQSPQTASEIDIKRA